MKLDGGTAANLRATRDETTVRPPFDPVEFARQSEMSTVPPAGQVPDLDSVASDPVVSSETIHEVLFVEADTVPALAVAREDLEWFDLAPAVRAFLGHIDGEAALNEVCSRSARPVDEGIALVEQLIRDGLVVCR